MTSPRAIIAGIAAIAALLTGGGIAYAATSAAPTASKADTIVTTTANVSLGSTAQVVTTIATIRLPPGAFVLQASGDLVNFGPSDYTRCRIYVGGTQVAAVATLVGDPTQSGAWGPAGRIVPFTLVGGAVNRTSSTQVATLGCEYEHNTGATPYVDANATLWAHATRGLRRASA